MGYILVLKFQCYVETLSVVYTEEHLISGQITSSNIKIGEKLSTNSERFLIIDNRKKTNLLSVEMFQRLFDWKYNNEPFYEKDFFEFDYLKFEINKIPLFVILHAGVHDTYCLIDVLPWKTPGPLIIGSANYVESELVDGFFEQEIYLQFRNI